MSILRRIAALAIVSLTGVALLAPLAARSAAAPVSVDLPEHLLPASSALPLVADRSLLSARSASLTTTAATSEAIAIPVVPAPASVQMQATLVTIATPQPAPTAAPRVVSYDGDTVWDQLAQCESGGNWAINTGNGYYGGLQFDLSTWAGYGGLEFAERPDLASREQQIVVAERLHAARGFQPWPACRLKLGLP